MTHTKRFPIQDRDHRGCEMESWIPWEAIEPHRDQAIRNHSQTLEELAERGGLGLCEAVAVLTDAPWRRMDDARARLRDLVATWKDGA